jgi:hypothetical protein
VFDIMPQFLFNVLNAFMYFLFGFHSFLYVYDEKNKEKYEDIPEDFKPTNEEAERESLASKTEKGDADEKGSMMDKMQKDLAKKAADQMIEDTKGQIVGVFRDIGEDKPNEKKEEKGFLKSVFSFSFMKTKKIRFILACLLYLIASLNSEAFKNIWKLRENNSLAKVFFICLLIFALCGLVLATLAYIVKKKIYKNYVKSTDNIKMVKSFACASLIFISFIQLFS